MIIKKQVIPEMTLEEFADLHNLTLILHERPVPINSYNRFYAYFDGVEIIDGGILISAIGNGKTEEEAVNDYVLRIHLKRLVVNAYGGKYRVEIEKTRIKYDN